MVVGGLSVGLRNPTQQSRVVGRCTEVFSDVIRVIQRGKVDSSHYTGRKVPQWPPVFPYSSAQLLLLCYTIEKRHSSAPATKRSARPLTTQGLVVVSRHFFQQRPHARLMRDLMEYGTLAS